MLNITDVNIRPVRKEDGRLKAVASIVVDGCFAVHDIKIICGERGNFIAMPSRRTSEGDFRDVCHPLDNETREHISTLVLAEFDKLSQ